MMLDQNNMFNTIRKNIKQYGYHVYSVSQNLNPRFIYTIGLTKKLGFEILIAGSIFYNVNEIEKIFKDCINYFSNNLRKNIYTVFLNEIGSFSTNQVHQTWIDHLMLGAIDFYDTHEIRVLQIKPDRTHWTIDIPDMSVHWSAISEPAWRWLQESWSFPVPTGSTATTNIAALQGELITEAARWEEDDWELFAGSGPDVSSEDMRVVPIGTLLSYDESLSEVISLSIGEALWREKGKLEWNKWKST